jgi:hypothetical protein
MEVINHYAEIKNLSFDKVARYRLWSSHLYKWPGYVANRKRTIKQIDSWSQKFLDSTTGIRMAYACGGLFYKDIDPHILVVEHDICPYNVGEIIYLNGARSINFGSIDSMISVNPQSLKYNHSLWDFISTPRMTRAGWKPNLLEWFNTNGTFFLSFSDWHMYYDRLKMSPGKFIDQQIKDLAQHSIMCEYLEVQNSDYDVVNGNVKMILRLLDKTHKLV